MQRFLGGICYSAFKAIVEAHNFAPDFQWPATAYAPLTSAILRPATVSAWAYTGTGQAANWPMRSAQGTARVAERAGRITGYGTCVAFFGHAVGESSDDLKALIGAAEGFPGPGFLVATRNGDLMRWCRAENLRIIQTMTFNDDRLL